MTNWVSTAEIIASLATVGALLALVYEIRTSRLAEKRQAAFEISARMEQLSKKIGLVYEMSWESMEEFDKKYTNNPETKKYILAFYDVTNYFESLGEAAFNELIDVEMVKFNYGEAIVRLWRRFQERIEYSRHRTNSNIRLIYFEWLALEIQNSETELEMKLINATEALRKKVNE